MALLQISGNQLLNVLQQSLDFTVPAFKPVGRPDPMNLPAEVFKDLLP
jgi:hypothetical protein